MALQISTLERQIVTIEGTIRFYEWIDPDTIKLEIKESSQTIIGYYEYKKEEFQTLEEQIRLGNKILIKGQKEKPLSNTIPNTFSYQTYLMSQKIFHTVRIQSIKQIKKANVWNRIKEWIVIQCEKSKNEGYLKKLLLGISSRENNEISKIYQKNGISHIFAISGLHFYFLFHLLNKIGKKITKKENVVIICAFLVLTFYFFLLRPSISSKRAYLMLGLMTFNQLTKQNISTKVLFYYNVIINLWLNPYIIFNSSFYYSYLLSFSLVFCSSKKKDKGFNWLRTGIMLFLFSLPITVKNNYAINPWSFVNNLFWIPIITSVLFPILLLNFIFPSLDLISYPIIKLIEKGNIFISTFPFSEFIMPRIPLFLTLCYYFCLVAIFCWNKNRLILILVLLLIIWKIYPKLDSNSYFYFLDVGQGDSTLIISPFQKEIILIDTGPRSEVLQNNFLLFLKSLGVTKINVLILTHGDSDHLGNALWLLSKIKISKILLNQGPLNLVEQTIKNKYREKIISNYKSEKIKFHLLEHSESIEENQNSIITHICLFHTCTLFLGDANQEVEEEILKKYQIKANVLKVGHHGSRTSTSNTLLKQVPFQIGIISAGRNNFYHHPHEIVLERLKKNQVAIYNTQTKGTIRLKINQKGYTIETNPP